MFIRKVLRKEYFHYTNGTYFDSGTALYNTASTADNWTVTYNGTTGGYVTSPTAGTEMYLSNALGVTVPETQLMFEFHCKASAWNGTNTNGTEGVGLAFCTDAIANATVSTGYRLRQCADGLYVDQMTAGNWTNLININATAALNTDYYYRIIFFAHSIYLHGAKIGNGTAGSMYIYRGTTYDSLDYKGTTAGSPVYVTGNHGPYKGSATTATFKNFGVYGMYNLDIDYCVVEHKLDEDSRLTFALTRNPDQIRKLYSVNDRVETWLPETDLENAKDLLRLYFDGKIEGNPNDNKEYFTAIGHTRELARLPWYNGTLQNGTVSGLIRSKLGTFGGTTNIPLVSSTDRAFVLHGLNVNGTSLETSRYIQGKDVYTTMKQLMSEVDYFSFYYPDGRFIVSDKLLDESIVIDTTSQYLMAEEPEVYYDGTQMINLASNYYNGYTTPLNGSDSTSVQAYGPRGGSVVDMHVNSTVQAGRVNTNIIANNCGNPEIVRLRLLQSYFNVLPGKKIGVKLAGTALGTNDYDIHTENWTTYFMTCTETRYDSRDGIHEIVLVVNDQNGSDTAVTRDLPIRRTGQASMTMLKHLASMDT